MRYLLLLICCQYSLAQDTLIDHFSDGNLTEYPEWKGDTASFMVNTQHQLWLNAEPNESPQQVFITSNIIDSAQWSLYCEMLFNPSGQNYTEIVLVNPDSLFGNHQKLSLELGRFQDKITLRSFNSGITDVLLESDQAVFTQTTNQIWCHITHVNHNWTIEYSLDSLNWVSLPSFTHTVENTSTFGLICHYTSSRKDKFVFDDVFISGYPYQDTDPPVMINDSLIETSNLQLTFSESIDSHSVLPNSNIFFKNGTSTINQTQWINPHTLHLTFDTLDFNTPHVLQIHSITDINANTIADTSVSFYIQRLSPYDLQITELMIDPDPPVYLPETEYIELKNNTTYPIDLNTCLLRIGEKYFELPKHMLLPEQVVVVYPSSGQAYIDSTNQTLFLSSNFSLPNTSGTVEVLDSGFQSLHIVNYSDNWYNNPNKQDGGWSLEQRSSDYPCLQQINWQASDYTNGGSPGEDHSQQTIYDDLNTLQPEVFANTDTSLILRFPFSVLDSSFLFPAYYNSEAEIKSIIQTSPFELNIILNTPLTPEVVYTMEISNQLHPCFEINWETLYFGLTTKPKYGSMVCSEVLFDVDGDHCEFIEYKNTSQTNIDLYDLALTVVKDSTISTINCSNTHQFISPDTYVVLAKDLNRLFTFYDKHPDAVYAEIDQWITLDDKQGEIQLLNRSHQIIDSACYNYTWHTSDLQNIENVSLERIDLTYPSCTPTSWASASEPENFATPGKINSQHVQSSNASEPLKSFSPNNDGINDQWIYTIYFSSPENKIDA